MWKPGEVSFVKNGVINMGLTERLSVIRTETHPLGLAKGGY